MSNFKIRDLTLYSFLILIAGLLLSGSIMLYYLYEVKLLDERLKKVSTAHNSFLEFKLSTERLLTTIDLEKTKVTWTNAINKFNYSFNKLPIEQKVKLDELWYISQKEIIQINKIFENKILSASSLQSKPILMKKGELFVLKDTSSLYTILKELSKKIEYLLQYEEFILKEFYKIEQIDIIAIKTKIETTTYTAIFFPILVLILAIFFIIYTTKKVASMERNLLKTQESLKDSIEKEKNSLLLINNIIESVPVSIFWKDENSIYLGANSEFLKDANLTNKDEIIGKDDFAMPWGASEAQNYRDDDKKVMDSGVAKILFEETQTTSSGDVITLLTSKVPLLNTQGKIIGILGSYIDITQQKKNTEELNEKDKLLAQQAKLAAMGEMLENIAHQWRQPLSIISTASSGLKMQIQFNILKDEDLISTLDKITDTAMHLSETINDFRDYFKADKESSTFDINSIIEKALSMLESKFKNRNIEVFNNSSDVQAFGLANEFLQVIMNILNNSRDALEQLKSDKKLVFIDAQLSNDKETMLLTIKDNGGGIDKKIVNRIFEPYFTTKHQTQGTGIGLYMSKEMIEKHMYGTLDVSNETYIWENQSYTGAKFSITLPVKNNNKG